MIRLATIKIWLPALGLLGVLALVLALLAGAASQSSVASMPSDVALADIPADYYDLYTKAGSDYDTDWWVLAGIGKVETNHGRSPLPGVRSGWNGCGAAGPMQFGIVGIPGGAPAGAFAATCGGNANGASGTWAAYAVDGDGDGRRDVYAPADAIPTAAAFTRANGAPRDWPRALMRYNASDAYYQEVMHWAQRYRTLPSGQITGPLDPAQAAKRNISTAGLKMPALLELRNANSWGLHLISGYRGDALPEHPSGLAMDLSNGYLTPEMAAYAESLRQRGAQGAPIHGVIYNNRSTGYGGDWTWRNYGGGFTGNATQDHKDHVHVWLK